MAIEYLNKAIGLNEKSGYKTLLHGNYANLGSTYFKTFKYLKAIEAFEQSKKLCIETQNEIEKAYANIGLANCCAL